MELQALRQTEVGGGGLHESTAGEIALVLPAAQACILRHRVGAAAGPTRRQAGGGSLPGPSSQGSVSHPLSPGVWGIRL